MKLHELSPAAGSTKEAYRKGRGAGSGNGKTGGRGHKGQKARSGGGVRIGFEGGQMPLARRTPKRGFNNIFAKPYEIINLSALNVFEDGETVNAEALLAKGILNKCEYGYKVLGNGKVTKKVNVEASAFSASAKEAIEAAHNTAILDEDWEAPYAMSAFVMYEGSAFGIRVFNDVYDGDLLVDPDDFIVYLLDEFDDGLE